MSCPPSETRKQEQSSFIPEKAQKTVRRLDSLTIHTRIKSSVMKRVAVAFVVLAAQAYASNVTVYEVRRPHGARLRACSPYRCGSDRLSAPAAPHMFTSCAAAVQDRQPGRRHSMGRIGQEGVCSASTLRAVCLHASAAAHGAALSPVADDLCAEQQKLCLSQRGRGPVVGAAELEDGENERRREVGHPVFPRVAF